MAHIKEPEGVDFVIESDPLTEAARQEISEFIRNCKKSSANKKSKFTNSTKQLRAVNA